MEYRILDIDVLILDICDLQYSHIHKKFGEIRPSLLCCVGCWIINDFLAAQVAWLYAEHTQ